MSWTALRTSGVVVILLTVSPDANAADAAYDWLMRMNQATRELTYDGTFVYQHDDQLEAMRIIHLADKGSVQERLVSLNGAAREVIRDDSQVMCYLPDRQSVFVEHRLGREKSFPAILPERVKDLEKSYVIKLSKLGRVTGREAQVVTIRPRDQFRYGYHLWADKKTGLLLKADLVDHMGKTLEQFMFTHVTIGRKIDPSNLQPAVAVEGLAWYWGKTVEASGAAAPEGWSVTRLPGGFKLANRIVRKNPTRANMVQHLVYSDGLAAVSVFIEKTDSKSEPAMVGASRMGAVHAYGNVVNGHQIIVVGEVPAATVEMIGTSVVARQQAR
ncbi:MAG: MucB/RseB C-terminal domain-containing protein [Acidiferrobacterales bacterium]